MRFEGKKAVIAGGGGGQGEAMALAFAREGADVAVLDLKLENAERVAKEVKGLGRQAIALEVNVASFQDVNDCVKKVYQKFKRIDILVNAAGYGQYGPLAQMSEETWDRSVATHLKGTFNATRAVINGMIAQRSGRIINISSVAGLAGAKNHSQYGAAKAGVIGFTKSVAKEVAEFGITVNAIAPGMVDTPYLNGMRKEAPERLEGIVKAIPMCRPCTPEEVAELCLYFASDKAGYVTGQVISISGGMWI